MYEESNSYNSKAFEKWRLRLLSMLDSHRVVVVDGRAYCNYVTFDSPHEVEAYYLYCISNHEVQHISTIKESPIIRMYDPVLHTER